MTRLLTVTLNPAVDRTVTIDGPLAGVARASTETAQPGGKGLNVARVARALGAQVTTTGIVGGHAGRWMIEELTREGLDPRFVETTGETRTTVAIYGPETGEVNIVEQGPTRSHDDLQCLLRRVQELLPDADAVAASGSIPPGLPPRAYRDLVDMCARAERPVLIDTAGDALRDALGASPTVVKLTEQEARSVLGDGGDEFALAQQLVADGATVAVVTLGGRGAVAATPTSRWRVTPPAVERARAIGSGDAFAAALLVEWLQTEDWSRALRAGAAAGAANAMSLTAGRVDPRRIVQLLGETRVENLH